MDSTGQWSWGCHVCGLHSGMAQIILSESEEVKLSSDIWGFFALLCVSAHTIWQKVNFCTLTFYVASSCYRWCITDFRSLTQSHRPHDPKLPGLLPAVFFVIWCSQCLGIMHDSEFRFMSLLSKHFDFTVVAFIQWINVDGQDLILSSLSTTQKNWIPQHCVMSEPLLYVKIISVLHVVFWI